MKDYEQLYYDSQYKIKQLENELKVLKEKIYMYETFNNKKDLKKALVDILIRRIK